MFASAWLAKIGTHKRLIQMYVGLNLLSHLVKAQKQEEEYALAVIFVSPSRLPVAQFCNFSSSFPSFCQSNISLNSCVCTTAWHFGQQHPNVVSYAERWAVPSEKAANWGHSAGGYSGPGAQRVRDAAHRVWTEPGGQWASRYVSKHTFTPLSQDLWNIKITICTK